MFGSVLGRPPMAVGVVFSHLSETLNFEVLAGAVPCEVLVLRFFFRSGCLGCAVWPFLHSFENWYRFVFKVFGDGLIAVPSATYGCLGLIGSASWLSSLAMNFDVIRFFVFRSGWLKFPFSLFSIHEDDSSEQRIQ
ncbi:hypothetical protein Acr_28g0001940 [Actinidia rufa]|uniref:Uncharacterized protein n=1 Tax=Actinidia rufa TaxID=165716 RepID=A0A7J0H8V0_9ERIC|nr:hypothetical protein Acr_28g0001940 [Actinidia rufa]